MSRYTIATREPDKYECVVGYDPSLDTFFGQVIDLDERRREDERHEQLSRAAAAGACLEGVEDEPDEEREPFVVWVGTSPRQISDVVVLRQVVEPYANLTLEVKEALLADGRRESHPPTEFQRRMRELVERIEYGIKEN